MCRVLRRTLFEDGYDAAGNRVYDKVNGLTCHQCRQKTLGKRTCCAGCESLQVPGLLPPPPAALSVPGSPGRRCFPPPDAVMGPPAWLGCARSGSGSSAALFLCCATC